MGLNIRRWTLRSKVLLHVVALGIASAGILTALFLATQRNLIYTLSEQKAELLGSILKSSIFMLKKCGRIEDTQAKIHELSLSSGAIKRIRILSSEGRIFASTDDGESQALLPAGERRRIEEMLANRVPRQVFLSRSDFSVESLMLVENKPECYACHNPANVYNGLLQINFAYGEAAVLLRKSQAKGILIAVLSLAILSTIILRLFNRLINRPISRLKNEMKRIQDGDYAVRLTPTNADEIGSLVTSFNAMVENLRDAQRKIGDLFKERIERAEHLATFGELAAGLAHEVKNPLTGMKGALEIISQNTPASDPQKEIFQEILVQIGKIINIIQDFLSYARPKPMQFVRVHPGLFIENAVRLAKTQVGGKVIAFDLPVIPEEIRLCCDADKMQEVMLNLILNSVAAVEAKGRIRVGANLFPGEALEVTVSDDGAGIKDANLAQIFTPFFSTKVGGTGLGLSICKAIIDAHRGTIAVESQEGRGTTFRVRLPLDLPCA